MHECIVAFVDRTQLKCKYNIFPIRTYVMFEPFPIQDVL